MSATDTTTGTAFGEPSEDAQQPRTTRSTIKHNLHQRASPPTAWTANREPPLKAAPGQVAPEELKHWSDHSTWVLEQNRWGPRAIRSLIAGGMAAFAFSCSTSIYYLMKNNMPAWQGTFRHRLYLMSPLIAMYITANDIVPLPYKAYIEEQLGRKAILGKDVASAKEFLKLEAKARTQGMTA